MEPLHQFVIDLETFLNEKGYELSGSNEGDVNLYKDGRFIGYWSGYVNAEDFRELK